MSLAVEQSGTGTPLIFLHAFPLDRRMWIPQAHLARHYKIVTIDFPGFGGSPISAPTASMEWMAREVISTLNGINLTEPAVFIGLSMGGYVLLQLAQFFPERIRAAVFVSTKSTPDSDEARKKRFDNIEIVEKEGVSSLVPKLSQSLMSQKTHTKNPLLVEEACAIMDSQTPQAVVAALRGMAERTDMTPVLETLSQPALFMSGADDPIIKPEEMERMSKLVKTSEFHVIADAGHLLNMEASQTFDEILDKFLKRRVL